MPIRSRGSPDRSLTNFGGLHKLSAHYESVLGAAALLHDIGYAIAHESHHKHSLYIILNSELTGFSDQERLIAANIARYHRKSMPKEKHPQFELLSEAEKEIVWKLGAILRIADALDRSHEGFVEEVACAKPQAADGRHADGRIVVKITSKYDCEHELWAAERKADMFIRVFGPIEFKVSKS